MSRILRLLLPALLLPNAVHAQHASPVASFPDPATIKTPDVTPSHDPQVRKNGYKFYYFHNGQVNFAQAFQDLKDCRAHLTTGAPALMPVFIPWDEAHRSAAVGTTPAYGVVGAELAAIILPKLERGQRSNKMRRCMGTRGYDRYAITEQAWDTLNGGDEAQVLLMQAKLASGPKPRDEAVTE